MSCKPLRHLKEAITGLYTEMQVALNHIYAVLSLWSHLLIGVTWGVPFGWKSRLSPRFISDKQGRRILHHFTEAWVCFWKKCSGSRTKHRGWWKDCWVTSFGPGCAGGRPRWSWYNLIWLLPSGKLRSVAWKNESFWTFVRSTCICTQPSMTVHVLEEQPNLKQNVFFTTLSQRPLFEGQSHCKYIRARGLASASAWSRLFYKPERGLHILRWLFHWINRNHRQPNSI